MRLRRIRSHELSGRILASAACLYHKWPVRGIHSTLDRHHETLPGEAGYLVRYSFTLPMFFNYQPKRLSSKLHFYKCTFTCIMRCQGPLGGSLIMYFSILFEIYHCLEVIKPFLIWSIGGSSGQSAVSGDQINACDKDVSRVSATEIAHQSSSHVNKRPDWSNPPSRFLYHPAFDFPFFSLSFLVGSEYLRRWLIIFLEGRPRD